MAKKGTTGLGSAELSAIKSFYEQERIQLAAKLQHVDDIIARLGGNALSVRGASAQPTPVSAVASAPVKRGPGRPRKTETEAKAKKSGRPKKRGPKSVWGNFILRRLRQCDRPLSYSELVRDAMVLNNISADRAKNAKASVLNAAFRLRNTMKKIDTVGLPGKKEKFLVLTSWLDSQGKLKAPYDKLFDSVAVTPMDDRGRKPRRPSAADATEKAAAKPAAKKATTRKAAAMPAAKKATTRKTAAKPAAKKATTRKAAAKPVAKKATTRKTAAKPAAKKATTRKAASKPTAKKATTRKAAAKPAAKKATTRKAAAKPAAKKATTTRRAAKKKR